MMVANSLVLLTAIPILLLTFSNGCSSAKPVATPESNGVVLSVSARTPEKILLKLDNRGTEPIFLGFETDGRSGLSYLTYRIICTDGDREKDYGPEFHNGLGLDRLEPGSAIAFEVFRPREAPEACKVSIGFYSNEKAAEIVESVTSSTDPRFTKDQEAFLDESLRSVSTQVKF